MDGQIKNKNPLNLDEAMKLAIQEAYKGEAFVSPNPKVGCCILDSSGFLLATGFHQKYGGPHAEVEALKKVNSEQLKDSHVIVTLEPCAHEGKTPSCAKSLAQLPVKKVTYGILDPNPLVSGKGHKILQEAGKIVEEYQGPLKSELEKVCEEFLVNQRENRIFVALKVAQSLDGKIALLNGKSQWITGEESRLFSHRLRAQYDGILVGRGTVTSDNPSLDIRLSDIKKENHVVVWGDSEKLKNLSQDLKLFKNHTAQNIHLESGSARDVLKNLYNKGLRSLLIEGGSQTAATFLKEGLVDRLHLFIAPIILGKGLGWTDLIEHNFMEQVVRLKPEIRRTLGQDQYLSFKL